MKKLAILAIMAFTGLSMFAGTYTFVRYQGRSATGDLSKTAVINEQDQYIKPEGQAFISLYVQAYAECYAYGSNSNYAFSRLEYFSAFNASPSTMELLGRAQADYNRKELSLPYQNLMQHIRTTGRNSLLIRHLLVLPSGAYGNMKTALKITASYKPIY